MWLQYLRQNFWFISLVSFIAGSLLTLAFAPYHWYYLAIVSPAVLVLTWSTGKAWHSFLQGLWFGLGFFGFGVSWVFISIHHYGNTSILLALFLTAIFIITLALFIAVPGYCYNRFFRQNSIGKILIVFPALWVLFTWLRSWFLTGFPWLQLGFTQVTAPLSGYLPIIGNYGVGFILTFTASVLAILILKPKQFLLNGLLIIFTILVWLLGSLLANYHWTTITGKAIPITIVQGNVPQLTKWDPKLVEKNFYTYWNLTKNQWNNGIIVWPENAIPISEQTLPTLYKRINQTAKDKNTAFITGAPIQANAKQFYNALLVLGDGSGKYLKRHLVPFGEYVPFERLLRGLINFFDLPMSNFIPGPIKQPLVQAKGFKIAPFICYEIAFANLVLSDLPQAQLLVTISDDTWFGNSNAADQHLQIAQTRSLQTGRYQLFATNSGPSAIINNQGRLVQTAPLFQQDIIKGEVYASQGITPWVRIGNWPIIIIIFLLLIAYIFTSRSTKKNRK